MQQDKTEFCADSVGPQGFFLFKNAVDRDELAIVSRWLSIDSVAASINAPRALQLGAGCPHAVPDELTPLTSIAEGIGNRILQRNDVSFNHITIQRHQPGQAVPPQRDSHLASGPNIAVFTFDCDATYDFKPAPDEFLQSQTDDIEWYSIPVPALSVFFLTPKDARYIFEYSVGRNFARPRTTVTLRSVNP